MDPHGQEDQDAVKLRILNNSIRLRLTVREVAQIGAGQAVVSRLHLPGGCALSYSLVPAKAQDFSVALQAERDQASLVVSAPAEQAEHWADSPALVSLESSVALDGGTLSLLVEKDFACRAPRTGDDLEDLFVNPGSLASPVE